MNAQSGIYEVLISSEEYSEIKKQNEELKKSNLMMIEQIRRLEIKIYELTSYLQDGDLPKKVKQLSINTLKIGQKFMLIQEQLFQKQENQRQLLQQSGSLYREAFHKISSEDQNRDLIKIYELQKEILKIRQESGDKINDLIKQKKQYIEQLKEKQNNWVQLKNEIVNKELMWSQSQEILKKQMQLKQQRQSQQIKDKENQIISLKEQLNQQKQALEQFSIQNNKLIAINHQYQQEAILKNSQILHRENILAQKQDQLKQKEQWIKTKESQVDRVARQQCTAKEQIVKKQFEITTKQSNLSQHDLCYKTKMSQLRIFQIQLQKEREQLQIKSRRQQQDYENKLYSLKAFDTLQQYGQQNNILKQRIRQLEENVTIMMLRAEEKQQEATAVQQTLNSLSENQRIQEVILNNFQTMIKLYKEKLQKYNLSEQKQRLHIKKEILKKGLDKIFQELMRKK